MKTITIFGIIERAGLKRQYIEALVKHVDQDAFMAYSHIEVESHQGQIEDFLWNLIGLDLQTTTEIANKLVRENEPTLEIEGLSYKFSSDGTFTATRGDAPIVKGYWTEPR